MSTNVSLSSYPTSPIQLSPFQSNKDYQFESAYAQATNSKLTPLIDLQFPSAEQGIIFQFISLSKIYGYLIVVIILNKSLPLLVYSKQPPSCYFFSKRFSSRITEASKGLIIDGKEIRVMQIQQEFVLKFLC